MIDWHKYLDYKEGHLYWKIDRKKLPAGGLATWVDKDGYLLVTFPKYFDEVSNRVVKAHRIIWEMFNGPIPSRLLIEHENGKPDDNTIANLRLATHQQNNWNKKAVDSVSKTKGAVVTENGKFRSRIRHPDGQRISLGTFDTASEAQAAYIGAATVLFGPFARKE